MILDLRKGADAPLQVMVPTVMKVERCAMIDQPQGTVPDKQVNISWGSIYIGYKRIEPHNSRCEALISLDWSLNQGIKGNRAWQIIKGKIQTFAGTEQVLDFRIRLRARKPRVEMYKGDFRHGQPEHTSYLS